MALFIQDRGFCKLGNDRASMWSKCDVMVENQISIADRLFWQLSQQKCLKKCPQKLAQLFQPQLLWSFIFKQQDFLF